MILITRFNLFLPKHHRDIVSQSETSERVLRYAVQKLDRLHPPLLFQRGGLLEQIAALGVGDITSTTAPILPDDDRIEVHKTRLNDLEAHARFKVGVMLEWDLL